LYRSRSPDDQKPKLPQKSATGCTPRATGAGMISRAYVLSRPGRFGIFRKRWSGKTDRAINAALNLMWAAQIRKQKVKDKQRLARKTSLK